MEINSVASRWVCVKRCLGYKSGRDRQTWTLSLACSWPGSILAHLSHTHHQEARRRQLDAHATALLKLQHLTCPRSRCRPRLAPNSGMMGADSPETHAQQRRAPGDIVRTGALGAHCATWEAGGTPESIAEPTFAGVSLASKSEGLSNENRRLGRQRVSDGSCELCEGRHPPAQPPSVIAMGNIPWDCSP